MAETKSAETATATVDVPETMEPPKVNEVQSVESPQNIIEAPVETKNAEVPPTVNLETAEEPKTLDKPKRARRTRKAATKES